MSTPATPGWALVTIRNTLRQVVLSLNLGAHLLLAVSLPIVSDRPGTALAVAGAHLLVGGGAGAALITPAVHPGWIVLATCVLIPADYVHATAFDDLITFGTAWVHNMTFVSAALVFRGRRALPALVVLALILAALFAVLQPGWGPGVASPAAVTSLAIVAAVRMAVRALTAFADAVDATARRAEGRREALVAVRTARQAAAESARTLHDTVVNTLGAIANGIGGPQHRPRVRELCDHDVATTTALLAGQAGTGRTVLRVDDVARHLGLRLSRRGLSDEELEGQLAELPAPVAAALAGAVREVLRNIVKHADVDEATVEVRWAPGGGPVITITDQGAGFDPGRVGGQGLAESVLGRSADLGISATVRSAAGQGTVVRLAYDSEGAGRDERGLEGQGAPVLAEVATAFRERTCWLWAAGVPGTGAVIELVNRFGYFSLSWAMLALLAAVSAVAWLAYRRLGRLPPAIVALLVASTPAVWLLSLAGVGFGHDDVMRWQTLGVTAPLTILLYLHPTVAPFAWASVASVATGLTTLVVLWQDGSPYVGAVLAGVVVPAAATATLAAFSVMITRLGRRAAADQRAAHEARLELAEVQAAASARERWQAAGIQTAIDLLRRIADGDADPVDPEVQRACASEEQHLRQILILSPELVHMGQWLARVSDVARRRGILLALRAGEFDAPDLTTAARLGELALQVVATVPPDTALTVGLFPDGSGGSLTLVGPTAWLDSPLITALPHQGSATTIGTYGQETIIESSWRN